MKIAIVNKFFFLRGGQETLMFEESRLLKKEGHEVAFFSMLHPQNLTTNKYGRYFAEYVEFSNVGKEYGRREKIKIAKSFVYNKKNALKFELFIKDYKPDIIHCHGIAHQLTYSFLPIANIYNIPVVQTLHDYQMICPCYTLLKGGGEVCDIENCANSLYVNCIFNKCVKDSLPASILSVIEMIYNHKMNDYSGCIDAFICPSKFIKDAVTSKGYREDKFVHIPNFINGIEHIQPAYSNKGYFLYFGRLSYEKGLFTLLKTFKKLNRSQLIVAGSGPLEKKLLAYRQENDMRNVEFVGFQSGKNLEKYIKDSTAVILPAEWNENAPMSIIEAFAYGVPVIATTLGGCPEMIKEGETGFLVRPGSVQGLSEKIYKFENTPSLAATLGKKARAFAVAEYNAKVHMDKLLKLYGRLTR